MSKIIEVAIEGAVRRKQSTGMADHIGVGTAFEPRGVCRLIDLDPSKVLLHLNKGCMPVWIADKAGHSTLELPHAA